MAKKHGLLFLRYITLKYVGTHPHTFRKWLKCIEMARVVGIPYPLSRKVGRVWQVGTYIQ